MELLSNQNYAQLNFYPAFFPPVHLFLLFQKQLDEFDKLTIQRTEQATKDCLPGIEVKQAHARLAMRERQLKELAEAMRDLSPEEVRIYY